jgi:hypothetical protein
MLRKGKRHKGKEMNVPNRNTVLQIQCPERDSGDEQKGKRKRALKFNV